MEYEIEIEYRNKNDTRHNYIKKFSYKWHSLKYAMESFEDILQHYKVLNTPEEINTAFSWFIQDKGLSVICLPNDEGFYNIEESVFWCDKNKLVATRLVQGKEVLLISKFSK